VALRHGSLDHVSFAVLIEINAKARRAIMGGSLDRAQPGGLWPSLAWSRPPAASLQGYSMPLFMYRCPITGYRVQGFVAEDTSEDCHVYEPDEFR
jgi:hypothetical protein